MKTYLLTVSGSKVMLVGPDYEHHVISVDDYDACIAAETKRIGIEPAVVFSSQMDMPDTRNRKTLALINALRGRPKPCCAPDCTAMGIIRIENDNWFCQRHIQERLNSPVHMALRQAIEDQETFLDEGGKLQ